MGNSWNKYNESVGDATDKLTLGNFEATYQRDGKTKKPNAPLTFINMYLLFSDLRRDNCL